jgi:8-oxo-dGTP diphosphatase
MPPAPQGVCVTAGVIARDGKVLVCQRSPEAEHGGKWEFPGGKVEPGENLPDCLRRELFEELGIDAVVGPLLWRTRHDYPGGKRVVLHFFFVEGHSGSLRNRVFAAVRWAAVAHLQEMDFLEADREFVAAMTRGDLCCAETRVVPAKQGAP